MKKRMHTTTILFAKMSIPYNTAVALGKVALGIYSGSVFIAVCALYNIGLALIKVIAVQLDALKEKNAITDVELLKKQRDFFMIAGGILFVVSVIYIIYCARMFVGHKTLDYSLIVGITIATVTFTEIGVAIRGVVITSKANHTVLQAIKLTNLATALISLVLTQTAIMSFSFDGDASFYNGLSGIIFGGTAALIGIIMVIYMQFKKTHLNIKESEGVLTANICPSDSKR